jgi:hypothetical protein
MTSFCPMDECDHSAIGYICMNEYCSTFAAASTPLILLLEMPQKKN